MTKDDVPQLLRAIKSMQSERILVGVPDTNADRQAVAGEPASKITNAGIALVMEFGDPSKNIPARPFLVPAVVGMKDSLPDMFRTVAQKVLTGGAGAVQSGFTIIGQRVADAVKKKITDGPFQELSIRTIEARARRGRKGAQAYLKGVKAGTATTPSAAGVKPLIDTGQLRRAINFVIRPK
jgi:hypothetical protein